LRTKRRRFFFDVLLDRIERFLPGNFHLCVSPAGYFDDHVEDAIVLVSKKRDVVEGRDNRAVLFNVYAVFECVGCANETGSVLRSHLG